MNEIIFHNTECKGAMPLAEELSEDDCLNSTIDIFHGKLRDRTGKKLSFKTLFIDSFSRGDYEQPNVAVHTNTCAPIVSSV